MHQLRHTNLRDMRRELADDGRPTPNGGARPVCGITACVGSDAVAPRLLAGLGTLEYRGYDSAGIGLQNGSGLEVRKREGEVERLVEQLATPEGVGLLALHYYNRLLVHVENGPEHTLPAPSSSPPRPVAAKATESSRLRATRQAVGKRRSGARHSPTPDAFLPGERPDDGSQRVVAVCPRNPMAVVDHAFVRDGGRRAPAVLLDRRGRPGRVHSTDGRVGPARDVEAPPGTGGREPPVRVRIVSHSRLEVDHGAPTRAAGSGSSSSLDFGGAGGGSHAWRLFERGEICLDRLGRSVALAGADSDEVVPFVGGKAEFRGDQHLSVRLREG